MRENSNFLSWLFHLITKPKFVLCCLAFFNFVAVPSRFTGLCFYNWKYHLWFAFLFLVAALMVWLEKWWSYILAALLTGPSVYGFVYEILKVFNVLAKSPEEAEIWGTPENWWGFITNHPEELMQIALAATIFCFALFYLIRLINRKHQVLP